MAMIFVNIHSHFPYRIYHCIRCILIMKTLLRVLPSDKRKSVYIVSNNMSMLNKKLLEI